jgi:hypothetical protein
MAGSLWLAYLVRCGWNATRTGEVGLGLCWGLSAVNFGFSAVFDRFSFAGSGHGGQQKLLNFKWFADRNPI